MTEAGSSSEPPMAYPFRYRVGRGRWRPVYVKAASRDEAIEWIRRWHWRASEIEALDTRERVK